MEWREEAIVLGLRRYAENSAVVEVMTAEHGRHAGLVRGASGRRLRGVLQPGNKVAAHWRARLSDHLGNFTIEAIENRSARLMDDAEALAGLRSLCALASATLPEREAHPGLYAGMNLIISMMEDGHIWPALLVRWELELLQELGFGLDLSQCAATGSSEDLAYVSPRTGRAVSREAGKPYHDRLLKLPLFMLASQAGDVGTDDIVDGLTLTGHFLEKHVLAHRDMGLPGPRRALLETFQKQSSRD